MGAGFQEEENMKCVVCKHGETRAGTATVTLTREQLTLVVKDVPAEVCDNCGEEYVDADITSRLLQTADDAARSGVQVDVRQYIVA